ncbi:MAG: carbamoyl-phosphate synthase small subunit [Myxococcota bacterium]|jgi:carbamoyl-phosphate synthase small subunit
MPIVDPRPAAKLLLADGRCFDGVAFGARNIAVGEICFNTSMTGYQEILTDPSYAGQIITMTYPEIGNYGVNDDDAESSSIVARGLVIRESSPVASNWRSTQTLEDYLIAEGVTAISGVDTRALTRHIREHGAQAAVITAPEQLDAAKSALEAFGSMEGTDLATSVTCAEPYTFDGPPPYGTEVDTSGGKYRVVAYDFGIKDNILRHLYGMGCDVTVVPATTPASEVLAYSPDGIFLSNGPGDPAAVTGAIEAVQGLIGKVPIFGICLGHQILALALGGRTFKLKYGHRGGNQPVVDVSTGRVEITSQNHGFAVADDSLPAGARVTHKNLNDHTVEGFEHPEFRLFGVQHHPEASPGPHDSHPHFARFIELMNASRSA